jgi:hypothetical protein
MAIPVQSYRIENLGDIREKIYPNDAGFLFSYKSQKWAHSELCNHFCNAVDGQKDKLVGYIFRWISP